MEREIFLNALEQEGLAARAAYLDAACAGQPALRQRIEELLRCHHEDPSFLNVPVMEQLATAEASLAFLGPTGEPGFLGRLDHYEVLELIGRGGTGLVLKARDTKLQRVVAISTCHPARHRHVARRFPLYHDTGPRKEVGRQEQRSGGSHHRVGDEHDRSV